MMCMVYGFVDEYLEREGEGGEEGEGELRM